MKITYEVRAGEFMRQLHYSSSVLLLLGTVVWGLLGRFRYALVALGLGGLAVLAGFGAVDDLLYGTTLGKVPVPLWYWAHVAVAVGLGAVLVVSSRREAVQQPRTLGFVALSLGVTALLVLWF
ncbi:hypothetical protein [Sphaerisporangium aureirubrum]|uniref:DUF2231 domain-containing protein n=1 Tax=Sphaerisporangium aureirubrum TaxID=1544736 RepID=A0ABW1NJ85_9ACTN